MTVAVAWVRRIRDCEELIFVSDSRYSGDGRNFDACPKALTLPRTDCAICFAGYTGHALPLLLQFIQAIDSHAPARRGSLDITSLRKHALKVFGVMSEMLTPSPKVPRQLCNTPDVVFLFGGYSWIKKCFELWTISYSTAQRRFKADPAPWLHYSTTNKRIVRRTKETHGELKPLGRIAFAGDQGNVARNELIRRLQATNCEGAGLDWEPFEVVRDMLRDPKHSETIGGAPQVVKVYQYLQSAPLGVYWPNKASRRITLQGRPCLGYERLDRWIFDPDKLRSEKVTPLEKGPLGEVE